MSDTFCSLPWMHLASKTNGDMRVCCQTNQGPNKGLLRDNFGNVLNLYYDDIEQTRNNPLLKDIRTFLMNGKRHPECKRCWDEEDAGVSSKRIRAETTDKQFFFDNTNLDGSITDKVKITDYDLRFGNFCNIKCVTCGPSDSNMWYDDHQKLYGHVDKPVTMQWPLRKEFWEDIEKQIPHMKSATIMGGEPFLIEKHYDFLKKCIELGYAKNISLEYFTNMTNIHKKAIDLWIHFKKVSINCSIDAYGELNDYIRFPSKWKIISRNLKILDDSAENIILAIRSTVSVFNIYYIDELIKWKFEQKFKKVNDVYSIYPIIHSHPLHLPHTQSIKIFPKESKIIIANKLRLLYDWINDIEVENKEYVRSKLIEKIEGYIHYMMSEDKSNLVFSFLQTNNHLDEIRKNKLDETTYKLLTGA